MRATMPTLAGFAIRLQVWLGLATPLIGAFMRTRARTLLVTLIPALLGACGSLHPVGGPSSAPRSRGAHAVLARAVDSMIAVPELRTSNWGVLVVDPRAADTPYSLND